MGTVMGDSPEEIMLALAGLLRGVADEIDLDAQQSGDEPVQGG